MSTPGLGLGAQTATDPQEAYRMQVAAAKAGIKRGASWFDWIAIFSIVNAVIVLTNGNWRFLLGLGITDLVNYFAQKSGGNSGQIVGLGVTVLAAAFYWAMGHFAKQGQRWAVILGMAFYLLDGGICLLAELWLAAAFHGYALYMLTRTFSAIKQYETAKQDAEAHGVFLEPAAG
jgi:hypothetical protein